MAVLAGGVKVRLGLLLVLATVSVIACGSEGSGPAETPEPAAGGEAAVRELIELAFTDGDPSYCGELYTEELLEQISGEEGDAALEECIENESDDSDTDARAVEVADIEIDGERASANATTDGGQFSGSTFELTLEAEEDRWLIDRIEDIAFDRSGFDAGLAERMRAEGFSPSEASCVVDAVRETYSSEEIESSLLEGEELTEQTELALDCLGPRSLRRSLAEQAAEIVTDQGLDEAVADCIARRVERLSDREVRKVATDGSSAAAQAFFAAALRRCAAVAAERSAT